MKAFHEGHPDVALELQVTRHPFSFIGDLDERQIEAGSSLKKKGTWRDRLLDYTGGNEHMRDQAMMGMIQAGKPLGIKFDYNCYIDRQPIDSQRMLLYAASHGKQEAYVSALSKRHFEHGSDGESASKRHTVLAAAAEAGLDYDDAAQFYDGDLLRSDVWKSYGDMPRRGISAIPLFVFNVPEIGLEGGPLRPHVNGKIKPPIVNGSMQVDLFVEIFTQIWEAVAKHRGVGKGLTGPPPVPAQPQQQPAAKSARTASMPLVGKRVRLSNLGGRPELNGTHGMCTRFDAAKGRYVVKLPTTTLLLKPANLVEAADDAEVDLSEIDGEAAAAIDDEEELAMF